MKDWNMMPYENADPFAEYIDKMRLLEMQVKLVAYHTAECARQAEKAADYALLAVHYVKEALIDKARRM